MPGTTAGPGVSRPAAAGARRRSQPRLTGRGAVLVMLVFFLLGSLLTVWLQAGWPGGAGYSAGCLLAVAYVRRESLLVIVTTPPLIFLIALIGAELLATPGGGLLAAVEGTALMLAAVAPWLFGGTIACLAAALARGLLRSMRDFGLQLAGRADVGEQRLS